MVEVVAASSVARGGRERGRSSPVALSEARRAWNRDRIGLVGDLRCECARATCRDVVPAVAERHRSTADQFLVAPAHFGGCVVVRAADRFFVVEPRSAHAEPRLVAGDA